MENNNYFHRWLLPMNGLQDGTPYAGRPVGNSPELMPLDNSLNREILHRLRLHCVLSRFVIDREGIYEEESNMRFSFLYSKGNHQRIEAYTGIKNGNPFFGEDDPKC